MKNFAKIILSGTLALSMLTGCSSTKQEESKVDEIVDEEVDASLLQDVSNEEIKFGSQGFTGALAEEASEEAGEETQAAKLFKSDEKDTVKLHRVFCIGSDAQSDEFLTVFYGNKNHYLMEITDECHWHKSSGVTIQMVNNLDINQVFPGFSSYKYGKTDVVETATEVILVVRFTELDKRESWEAAEKTGLFTVQKNSSTQYVDADSFCKSLEKTTYELSGLEITDYEIQSVYY